MQPHKTGKKKISNQQYSCCLFVSVDGSKILTPGTRFFPDFAPRERFPFVKREQCMGHVVWNVQGTLKIVLNEE